LFDDARTSPQLPSSTVTRHAVDGDEIAGSVCPQPSRPCSASPRNAHHAVDDAVFGLVAQCGDIVGDDQFSAARPQVRHRLAGRTIEHLADRNRRDQTVS